MGSVLSIDDATLFLGDQRRLRSSSRFSVDVDGSLVRNPRPRPSVEQTKVYKNPVHVRGRSVRLRCFQEVPEDPVHRWELSFEFDTTVPCQAIIYLGVEEDCVDWPPAGAAWVSGVQSFPAALGQKHLSALRFADVAVGGGHDAAGEALWACIEVQETPTDDSAADQVAAEWTKLRLTRNRVCVSGSPGGAHGDGCLGGAAVEVLAQQVRLPGSEEASRYELHEVYGSTPQDAVTSCQDCVVCLGEKSDTEVQPCRHMCLCKNCAQEMSNRFEHRSLRCPICRQRISGFLQIELVSNPSAVTAAVVAGAVAEQS